MSLVLRNEKGSQLTFNEMDGNFTYLEELSQTGSFTGSFTGDGSGLTGIPGVTPIATGSFATTGSNQFNGGQSISGSVTISGSISQVGIGTNNTFIGDSAGIARTTGTSNTLIGSRAGFSLNAGNSNTFVGRSAGNTTAGGTANTAVGQDALFSNSTGINNTAMGYGALSTAINSTYNVAIGTSAATVTGDSQVVNNPASSIFIGALTKPQGVSDTNTIVIGYGAIGNGDNTVTLGNDSVTATYLKGGVTGSSFTGSFVGDGSGLTGIPGVTPIDTGSFVSTVSFNEYTASVTESVVTAIVTNVASNYYEIDGIQAPKLSFVPGITYRFDLSGIEGNHPFKFSISPNGPTEYTTGVTSGSNFIQIQVGYDTTTSLYYYCTNHNGMGNEINVLGIDKLVTTASFNEFTSSYNSGSFSGSFVGDGSGLTGIPGITPINVGVFNSTITQSGSANTSQSFEFNNTDISQGVTLVSNSRLTIANPGTYNIQLSVPRFETEDAGSRTLNVFLHKNGTSVSNTTRQGHTFASNTRSTLYCNWVVSADASDYYEIVRETLDSDLQIINTPASGSIPQSPSVSVTVTQVR